MRKLCSLSVFFVACLWLFTSCKKKYSEEIYKPVTNPVIPDFASKVNAGVAGFITDENGKAVEGASINGAGTTVTSDKYGYFKISNAAFAKSAGFVQVTKSGYFTGYRTFLPIQSKESFIRLQLIPKKNAGSINSASGGTVTTTDGAKITLPPDAVVVASTNTAYTGTVNISAHWLNPSETQTTNLTMPGDLRGIDSSGYLKALVTYGMLAVELTGGGGEPLQVASNKKATLNFPIPASLNAAAPNNIPLWSFDETKGLWKQESRAVKNGSEYVGEVSHFSFWNCDFPYELVNFSAQIVDEGLNPLSYIPVVISIAGQPASKRMGYTDVNGFVQGMIPANSNLLLEVHQLCSDESIAVKTFSTAGSEIELGTLKAPSNYNIVTITGTAKRCDGSAVTNGKVFIWGDYNYTVLVKPDGSFSFTGPFCNSSTAKVIVIDLDSSKQSRPVNIELINGRNELGNIDVCDPEGQYISYTLVSGAPSTTQLTFVQPVYLLTAGYDINSGQTIISAKNLIQNFTEFTMNFTIPTAPGTYPIEPMVPTNAVTQYGGIDLTYYFYQDGGATDGKYKITITEYGLIGQFIRGYISSAYVISQPTQASFAYACSFNVKRTF